MTLFVPEARLSIYNRIPPKLPRRPKESRLGHGPARLRRAAQRRPRRHLGAAAYRAAAGHHALHFLDEKHGWAVGELGTICPPATAARPGRAAPRRPGIGRRFASMPAPRGCRSIRRGRLGGEQGYLAAALRVIAAEPGVIGAGAGAEPQRFAAAVRQSGGAAGEVLWQFPVPQHRLRCDGPELVKGWDQPARRPSDRTAAGQLVLAIRIWRPDVVLTDHPDRKARQTAEAVIAEAMHHAFQQAADPKAFPEQSNGSAWSRGRSAKVYSRWHQRGRADVVLDLTEPRAPGSEPAQTSPPTRPAC